MGDVTAVVGNVKQHFLTHHNIYTCGIKAAGLVLVTFLLAYFSPDILHVSARISPILAIQLTMACSGGLLFLWRKYSHDINLTLFRLLRLFVRHGSTLWKDYLTLEKGGEDGAAVERGLGRRKVVRMLVMFVMMRQCLQPEVPLLLLLAFVVYITCGDQLKFRPEEIVGFFQSMPLVRRVFNEYVNLRDDEEDETSTSSSDGPDGPDHHDDDNADNSPVLGFRQRTLEYLRTHVLGKLIVLGKVVIALSWTGVFIKYSPVLLLCMYMYVTVTRAWLERHLISVLLTVEEEGGLLAAAEGLEQYYIAGCLAVTEMLLTFVFMVWVLEQGHPLLMLVALYTNVYCTGYDVFTFVVTPAAYERAFLAKFQKVSGDALSEQDNVCAICLCNMGIARKTQCGHLFHGHCLRKLVLHGRNVCPMCRKPLLS